MERVKPIELTDNDSGKVYTLDFNRDVVRRAEKNGFSLSDCDKYPSLLYDLWYYSFQKNHEREITRKRTDSMLDDLGGVVGAPTALFERLGELYTQTYGSLNDEKNGRLTVTL